MSTTGRARRRPPTWRGILLSVLVGLALAVPIAAFAQQLGEGMVRTGTVGIQNETERLLFSSLICTCGCPREALSTCTCGFAHERRAELRAELAKGRTPEDIRNDYAKRFGSAALAVPPNVGTNQLLWMGPLVAVLLGGAVVWIALRRWSHKGTLGGQEPRDRATVDEYDEKLDRELKELE